MSFEQNMNGWTNSRKSDRLDLFKKQRQGDVNYEKSGSYN